jgi:hypothetical protein
MVSIGHISKIKETVREAKGICHDRDLSGPLLSKQCSNNKPRKRILVFWNHG